MYKGELTINDHLDQIEGCLDVIAKTSYPYDFDGLLELVLDEVRELKESFLTMKDVNDQQIQLGDSVRLTFNKGKHSEHKAMFDVIWKDSAFKIISQETGNESFIGSISNGVEIEVVK